MSRCQLPRASCRTECPRETFHCVALDLCTFANHDRVVVLPAPATPSSATIFSRARKVIRRLELRRIQFRVAVFRGDAHFGETSMGSLNRVGRPLAPETDLALHAYHRCGGVLSA